MVTDAMETKVRSSQQRTRDTYSSKHKEEYSGNIHRFWSLKNKFPASSRRLATLPMMAQAQAQVPNKSSDGARGG